MAYNHGFNPDALPKFAEPERKQPKQSAPSSSSSRPADPYYNKPSPPIPQQPRMDDRRDGRRDDYHSASRPIPPQVRDDRRANMSPVGQPSYQGGYGVSPPGRGGAPARYDGQRDDRRDDRRHDGRPGPGSGSGPGRGPASPANAGVEDPSLLPLFRAVDKDGSGHLSESELSAALVNGDWTSFDPHTVTLMIRMFDTSRSGTISFPEFCGLWSFLASWRTLFDRFDADKSGGISLSEFSDALVAFGYRLSESFVAFLFRAFDKQKKNQLSFDLFVQACISLKRMTDAFKKYDEDRDGFITLSFEQFLEEVLKQR